MGVTDSAMIGRAGTVPLAASAFGGNVFNVFFVVGIGLMIPVSILVSRARGGAKPEEASEYLRHGMTLALIFGAVETLMMVVLGTQLARFGRPVNLPQSPCFARISERTIDAMNLPGGVAPFGPKFDSGMVRVAGDRRPRDRS